MLTLGAIEQRKEGKYVHWKIGTRPVYEILIPFVFFAHAPTQVFDLCESVQICRIFADLCRHVQICRIFADLCRYVQICRIFADLCRHVQICRIFADLCRYVQIRRKMTISETHKKPNSDVKRIIKVLKTREKSHICHNDQHYSAQASFLLLFVESGTRKFRCLSVECLFVESGTNDVICQFCTVKRMVVESEILKALCCALSK